MLASINLLRIISCYSIVIFHTILYLTYLDRYFSESIKFMTLFTSNLWVFVDVFFVISGYLLGGHLLREINQTSSIDIKRFYLKRILRILPAYYFVLIIYIIIFRNQIGVFPVYYGFHEFNEIYSNLWTNLLFINNYVKIGEINLIPISWSLCVEMQFYFFLPFLIFLINKIRKPYLFLMFLCFIPSLFRYIYFYDSYSPEKTIEIYLGIHLRFEPFIFGILIFYWNVKRQNFLDTPMLRPLLIGILFVFGFIIFSGLIGFGISGSTVGGLFKSLFSEKWNHILRYLIISIWAGSFLILLLGYENRLQYRFIEVLARPTYSAYLIHVAIIFLILNGYYVFGKLKIESFYEILINLFLAIFCVALISSGIYFLIESPMMKIRLYHNTKNLLFKISVIITVSVILFMIINAMNTFAYKQMKASEIPAVFPKIVLKPSS